MRGGQHAEPFKKKWFSRIYFKKQNVFIKNSSSKKKNYILVLINNKMFLINNKMFLLKILLKKKKLYLGFN